MHRNPHKPPLWRTLLVLGRVSNLPTVWSNCLAGWLLGGDGEWPHLGVLCAGGSLLYTGGMFLNDACDRRFDSQHRSERPIPSGAIEERAVWIWSIGLLGCGLVLLALLGWTTALIAIALTGCIVFYDVVHKKTRLSPVIMAACRFLLYLAAASVALNGITPAASWSALALAAYIAGLSYIARKETTTHTRINLWALLLLIAPVVIALLLNGIPNWRGLLLMLLFAAWVCWCLRALLMPKPGAIGRAVSGLLSGIVLVDLLAVQKEPGTGLIIFPFLFAGALILQRVVPAT